jgi:dCMP deaminase
MSRDTDRILYAQDHVKKWDWRMLELAAFVAEWSKDPSTKVGAVVADEQHRVLGVGYNGFPRGVHDHAERYEDRQTKYKMVVHAEVNALLQVGLLPYGSSLYSTLLPCNECAKIIIQSGVRRVVTWGKVPEHMMQSESWVMAHAAAVQMFDEASVEVWKYPNE